MASEFVLSGKEICAIIRSCASQGVRQFTLGDLHIQFGGEPFKDLNLTNEYPITPEEYEKLSLGEKKPTSELIDQPTYEDFLSQVAIEDPSAWEELQSKGDVE